MDSIATSGSTAATALPSGVPQAAAEAWNSFSSKLPVTLKSQLTNLFDSLANIDMPPPTDVTEKPVRAGTAPSRTSSDMLRPAVGGGLGVLEEEGSDVGSSVLSPRSPRSPAFAEATPVGAKQIHGKHTSLAALASSQTIESSMLGFHVNEQGIAVPNETPAQDRRALVPVTNITKPPSSQPRKVAATDNTKRDENASQPTTSGGGSTFATMFAKRFKEARDNASDLLREAEKKLGSAMTIDDLLGVMPPPTTSASEKKPRASSSPRIQVDDHGDESQSYWYHAAGGSSSGRQPRRSTDSDKSGSSQTNSGLYGLFSQNIGPTDVVAPQDSSNNVGAAQSRHRLRAEALRTPSST